MARRRGRITVQHQPTGGEQVMCRLMGVVHAVFGFVFTAAAVTMIIPNAGLFGLPFLVAGLFFCINGIRIAVTKNDFAHRVGYDVETELDRSIVGLMEDVPDTTQEVFREELPVPEEQDSVQERLEQLKAIYEQELITKEEYDAKRQEILAQL